MNGGNCVQLSGGKLSILLNSDLLIEQQLSTRERSIGATELDGFFSLFAVVSWTRFSYADSVWSF